MLSQVVQDKGKRLQTKYCAIWVIVVCSVHWCQGTFTFADHHRFFFIKIAYKAHEVSTYSEDKNLSEVLC